ncbi:MAG: hypothetical protein U5L45_03015 [Saprospiraceae bacterium]|nr:hypothetical protein [Saprospiraceae bacterium]
MNKIKSVIGVVLLFAGICGYAYEMRYFTNTFASSPLFFRGLVLGALVGLGVFFTYKSKVEDALERFQLAAFFILLGMLVFPFLSIWSNHFFAKETPLSTRVVFQREEPIRTGRFGIAKDKMPEIDGFYTYFLKNEALDRVRSKRQLFRGVAMGQEVELPIKHGFWGFDFVETE